MVYLKRAIGICMCLLLVCLLAAGCAKEPNASGQKAAAPAAPAVGTEDQSLYEIETPYGSLWYPEQWREYLEVSQEQQGDLLQVTFSTKVGETDYTLFGLLIGDDGENAVGTLTDEDGTARNVFLSVSELMDIDELPENDQSRLYAMQEGLNDLLQNLK